METSHKLNLNSVELTDACLYSLVRIYESGGAAGYNKWKYSMVEVLDYLHKDERYAEKYKNIVSEIPLVNAFHLVEPYRKQQFKEPYI